MRASPASRAMMPIVSAVGERIDTPGVGIAPKVGLKPTTPLNAAGRKVEPPVCVPKANGICRAPTAAALPELEPPGVRESFQGFRVGAGSAYAKGVVCSLPIGIAPAL